MEQSEASLPQVHGHHIDEPRPGHVLASDALFVAGWVLGGRSRAVGIEVMSHSDAIGWAPVSLSRPDVAADRPGAEGADSSGWLASLDSLGNKPDIELQVRATFGDRSRALLGVIRGERYWQPDPDPASADLASVIVTCYNQARFLRHSLDSVLQQTYGRFEIVLVDDGSTDNTAAVARRYPRVRYVHQANKGLAAARNTGLRCSEGAFIVFLDADDRLLPEALETAVAALRAHPECPLVWGRHRFIDLDGSFLRDSESPLVRGDLYSALLERNVIEMHATVMYRRPLFDSVGVFDESLRAAEDHELLLRVSRRFPLHGHGALVAEYRSHGTTLTRDPRLMLASSMNVLRSQRPHLRTREAKYSYRVGKVHNRSIHGERLVAATILAERQKRYALALKSACILLRYHPAGLARLPTQWRPRTAADRRLGTRRSDRAHGQDRRSSQD